MDFEVTIVEIIEKKIKVKANDYNNLKDKLKGLHDEAGEVITEAKTEEMYCEIVDINGKNYSTVRLI